MRPKNELAEKLLKKLSEIGKSAHPGYHGGRTYCIGVIVDVAEAFQLGAQLGNEFGSLAMDIHPSCSKTVLAFPDAWVSA